MLPRSHLFSQMATLFLAVGAMIVFSLFVQMSEGATYSVVPFINRRALGSVAGIVGAGGNAGAVLARFLFRVEILSTGGALLVLGLGVCLITPLCFLVRFSARDEAAGREAMEQALLSRARGENRLAAASGD